MRLKFTSCCVSISSLFYGTKVFLHNVPLNPILAIDKKTSIAEKKGFAADIGLSQPPLSLPKYNFKPTNSGYEKQ